MNLEALEQKAPIVRKLADAQEVSWINPYYGKTEEALREIDLSMADVEEAAARLQRFAPFIRRAFPDTEETKGLIESPLREIQAMKEELNLSWQAGLTGRLLLKMDSHLAAAGSVKARGGIYEILKHAEELALEQGMIRPEEDYGKFAEPEMKEFFSCLLYTSRCV